MRFVKSILNVGKLVSPDGEVDVTADRLRGWEQTFRAMQAKGLVVPIDWDHAADPNTAVPLGLSDYQKHRSAKNSVGRLADFRVAADGRSAEITLDVEKPEAAESAEKNLVFVSPVIHPTWRDGDGSEYQDCITHVDFVNHPVEHRQGPFEPVNDQPVIACSLRLQTMPAPKTKLADDKTKAQRLATDENGEGDGETDGGEGGMSPAKMIADLGAQLGVELPDGVAPESDAGMVAILTVAMSKFKDSGETEPDTDDSAATEETTVAEPMMMSLQAKAALNFAERTNRQNITAALDGLVKTGRITPAEHKHQTASIPAVRLSLDKQGEAIPSDLEKFIASRQAVPAGTFWEDGERAKRLGDVEAIDHPIRLSAEPSEAETDAAAKAVLKYC